MSKFTIANFAEEFTPTPGYLLVQLLQMVENPTVTYTGMEHRSWNNSEVVCGKVLRVDPETSTLFSVYDYDYTTLDAAPEHMIVVFNYNKLVLGETKGLFGTPGLGLLRETDVLAVRDEPLSIEVEVEVEAG